MHSISHASAPAALLLVLAGPLASPLGGARDDVAFAPDAGTVLTKTFEAKSDFDLDDFTAIMDGQDFGSMMLGDLELTMGGETSVTVTDEYEGVEDGAPTRLQRSFDTIESDFSMSVSSGMGGDDQDMSSSSDLEGRTVVFEREEDGYAVSFADDNGDEELLEGLEEDMDLRFLLPTESVSEGDSWEVDVVEFYGLVAPGGDLAIQPDEVDVDTGDFDVFEDLLGDSMGDSLEEMLEGTATCTMVGTRDGDDGTLAEIEIALEISSAVDLSDIIADLLDAIADEQGEMIPFELDVADLNLDVETEGTLFWNLDTGHVSTLELSSSGEIALDFSFSIDAEGTSHDAEVSMEFSGTMQHSVSAE